MKAEKEDHVQSWHKGQRATPELGFIWRHLGEIRQMQREFWTRKLFSFLRVKHVIAVNFQISQTGNFCGELERDIGMVSKPRLSGEGLIRQRPITQDNRQRK